MLPFNLAKAFMVFSFDLLNIEDPFFAQIFSAIYSRAYQHFINFNCEGVWISDFS